MTASVGVGRAKGIVEAKRHIEKVMANMDAESIVTVIENVTELEQYVIIPKQSTYDRYFICCFVCKFFSIYFNYHSSY